MIIKMNKNEIIQKITSSNCFNSIRKLSSMVNGYLKNNGTGIIIKFNKKFYLLCLYHSFSDKNNEPLIDEIQNIAITYKTYLGEFDRENIKPEKYLIYPTSFCVNTISDDLMLSEKVATLSLYVEKTMSPIGYLDFDNKNFEKYLLSERKPNQNEILLACGFALSKNTVEITDEKYDDNFNLIEESKIDRVNHEVSILGGVCKQDELGFFIEKQDKNSIFGEENVNGVSGGIVMSMNDEWIGVVMRANDDVIRFIPYYLIAKSAIDGIIKNKL